MGSGVEWVEEAILEAGKGLRTVRSDKPRKYASFWPEWDDEVPDPSNRVYWADIDLMDRVLYLWLGNRSPIDRLAKRIIWARLGTGRRVSWRKVSIRL